MNASEGRVLYAFALNREVGVDIEHIRYISKMDQIVERFFSARKVNVFGTFPERKKKEALFNFWTRKEAFIKANGEGLRLGLDQFEVSIARGEQAALLSSNDNNPPEELFIGHYGNCSGPGFVAALAVQGAGSSNALAGPEYFSRTITQDSTLPYQD